MIASGSLTPGVDPAAWGLPAGTALRYERPDARLRALLPSYAVLDSDPAVWHGPDSWVLPGWPQIWIVLAHAPVTVRVRARAPARLGDAMMIGGTSRAMPVTSRGGVTVVVDVSPPGWARLACSPADAARDRVQPLDTVLGPGWEAELVTMLHGSDRAAEVGPLLDRFFLDRLPPPNRHEAEAARIAAVLGREGAAGSVEEAAATLAMPVRQLQRLSQRYLGYGPAVVRRRARFLRVLAAALTDRAGALPATPPGYHDASHFNRDGDDFLGLTPRRFLALPMPYLRAALRARAQVVGAPLPLLDPG